MLKFNYFYFTGLITEMYEPVNLFETGIIFIK